MNRQILTLLAASAALQPLCAQDTVSITTKDAFERTRVTIDIRSTSEAKTEILRDGEPMGGGRGGRGGRGGGRGGFGGPQGPTSVSWKYRFDDVPADGATTRTYLEAMSMRPGRDGEERKTESEMLDKPLYLFEDDRGMVVLDGDEDGEELPIRGLPMVVSFANVTPSEPVEIDEEFEFPAEFLAAMEGLVHDGILRTPRGRGGQQGRGRGGQGRGGQGRGGEGRGGQGRGGRNAGRTGGMMGMLSGGAGGNPISRLQQDGYLGDVIGKVTKVDGKIAKIAILAENENDLADMAEQAAAGGGGRGGFFSNMELEGTDAIRLEGEMWVNTETGQMVRLVLEGKQSTKGEGGADTQMGLFEMTMDNKAEFRISVEVEEAPEPKKKKGQKKREV